MAKVRIAEGVFLAALFLVFLGQVRAQTESPGSQLFITESDSSTFPLVTLRAYGLSGDGRPLDLADESLLLLHNGEPVEDIEVSGDATVGTMTVFLVDVTAGTEAQISAIQQTIEQFTTTTYMAEQVDVVAIYQAGESNAVPLQEPTGFYNTVRNLLASDPLEVPDGATALVDSLMSLLNDVSGLKPTPEMAASVIVFSDGTDAVSSIYEPEEVPLRAAELGIPIHTVWLENETFGAGQEIGRNYLQEVATGSRGLAARLDQPETVTPILERSAALRTQQIIRYRVTEPSGGSVPVVLQLADQPESQTDTTVTINTNAPVVTLNVPADSRTVSLPSLEEPVRLAFSGAVSWLDGSERSLSAVTLVVNNQPAADIPPDNLERFVVEIGNLVYGSNEVYLTVVDGEGGRGQSQAVALNIVEGEREIPATLQPGGLALAPALPICLAALALLAVFGFGGLYAYRSGRLTGLSDRLSRPRRSSRAAPDGTLPPNVVITTEEEPSPTGGPAYLEPLESETPMPSRIALHGEETSLGRSPSLADVAFEQDVTVSRLHATIIWDGQSYRLYDDDSTSGTWVNDQEVPDYGVQLFDGDEIFMGKVHLRFRQR